MFKDFFNRVAISEDQIPEYLNNISYTLATKRTLLKWRTFIVTDSLENLRNLEVMSAPIMHSLETPIFGFIFTGQGAQWANMGVELLKFPVFRGIIEQAEIYLKGLGCLWSILGECYRSSYLAVLCSNNQQRRSEGQLKIPIYISPNSASQYAPPFKSHWWNFSIISTFIQGL